MTGTRTVKDKRKQIRKGEKAGVPSASIFLGITILQKQVTKLQKMPLNRVAQ